LIALGLAGVVLWPMSAFFVIGMLFGAVNLRIPLKGRLGLLAGITCGAVMYLALEYLHPVYGLLPGFLVFGMVLAPGSGVATALSAPFLQYCGKISYSLYLVHPFALFPLQVLGLRLVEHGINRWLLWGAFVVLGIAVSLAAGSLSYELIEVRLRRWLDRILPHLLVRPVGGVGRPV
jgi:peptidoglycan/LPS O-acetylase OafA/YrhL